MRWPAMLADDILGVHREPRGFGRHQRGAVEEMARAGIGKDFTIIKVLHTTRV